MNETDKAAKKYMEAMKEVSKKEAAIIDKIGPLYSVRTGGRGTMKSETNLQNLKDYMDTGKPLLVPIFNPDSKGGDDLVSSFAPTESISLAEAIKRFPT